MWHNFTNHPAHQHNAEEGQGFSTNSDDKAKKTDDSNDSKKSGSN